VDRFPDDNPETVTREARFMASDHARLHNPSDGRHPSSPFGESVDIGASDERVIDCQRSQRTNSCRVASRVSADGVRSLQSRSVAHGSC
jgi:hypothetical protein